MCDDVAQRDSKSLQFVSDWFLMKELVKIWHEGDDYFNDDFEWYDVC